jgi:lipoyl(octanoyl) transferase
MSLLVVNLGTMAYADALDLQRSVAHARIDGRIGDDVLLLVEHPPVVTLGRSARTAHLVASPQLLAARGVELFEVERGGDVTFHGPGQLVGYPIIDLKGHRRDLHWYLRQVEEVLILALATFGLPAGRNPGYTGVWTSGTDGGRLEPGSGPGGATSALPEGAGAARPGLTSRKIASIGVHARDWVTWHGFALNVSTDLGFFDLIVPCGIAGVEMTTVSRELGHTVALRDVAGHVTDAFGRVFGMEPSPTRLVDLAVATAR